MAAILNLDHQQSTLSYLNAYHSIGRSATNADTVINAPEISRTHAVVEWKDEQWFIRDLSKNGTWVNNYKLVKDQPHALHVGDCVYFGQVNANGLVVKDLSRPQDMLIALESSAAMNIDSAIVLSDFNLLPSEEKAELALFYVHSKKQWYKEYLADSDGSAYPVADQDIFLFANQQWQLKLSTVSENTVQLASPKLLANQIKYRFNLSPDEETTELTIRTDDGEFSFANKAHHYLTLSLARHRDEDARKGMDEYSQGWILPEVIAKELGYDITLFNTQVCRAKKQFREVLKGACDGDELIERRGKRIRFSGSFYRIYKGSQLIVNQGQDTVSLTVLHG